MKKQQIFLLLMISGFLSFAQKISKHYFKTGELQSEYFYDKTDLLLKSMTYDVLWQYSYFRRLFNEI